MYEFIDPSTRTDIILMPHSNCRAQYIYSASHLIFLRTVLAFQSLWVLVLFYRFTPTFHVFDAIVNNSALKLQFSIIFIIRN